MRAKLVENIDFERRSNPKASMGIGGLSISHIRKDFIDQARIEWISWIEQHLIGKTITAKMNRIQKKIADGYEFGGKGWDDYTIKVDHTEGNINMDDSAILIWGEDNWMYALPIDDKKIYIENES